MNDCISVQRTHIFEWSDLENGSLLLDVETTVTCLITEGIDRETRLAPLCPKVGMKQGKLLTSGSTSWNKSTIVWRAHQGQVGCRSLRLSWQHGSPGGSRKGGLRRSRKGGSSRCHDRGSSRGSKGSLSRSRTCRSGGAGSRRHHRGRGNRCSKRRR